MAKLADIDRGTKYGITGTYLDGAGDPIDISNSEILFTMKDTPFDTSSDDSTAIIKKSGSITDGPNGEYSITLSPTETQVTPANYFYSIKIDVDGDDSNIKLLASGRVRVVGNTTNRTS